MRKSASRVVPHGSLIGLVLEGETEYQALPKVVRGMGLSCTRPSCIHGQPAHASVDVLAERRLLPHVRAQIAHGVHHVIVVLDLEARMDSADAFRDELRRAMRQALPKRDRKKVEVIICNPRFENWILADPEGITRSAHVRRNLAKSVRCHADGKDALTLLKSALKKGVGYSKAVHGPRLFREVRYNDPSVKLCSASFREFLTLLKGIRDKAADIR